LKQKNDRPTKQQTDTKSQTWDLAGVTLFRTLGYVVGLPSFIVGTALFMLGFALTDTGILHAACVLYSLAFIAIVGRPVLLRLNPQNETDAIKIAVASLVVGGASYAILLAILTASGIDML
jgi:hypothetical protein